MSYRWVPDRPRPPAPKPGVLGWARIIMRLLAVGLIFAFSLPVFGVLRALEGPQSPHPLRSRRFAGWVLGWVLRAIGLRLELKGQPHPEAVGSVANHSSWLDILVLFTCRPVTFVSKVEVKGWGILGWFARISGTLFVRRQPSAAKSQANEISEALAGGQHLVFFPEGTSTDGRRVLPFRSPLFQPFVEAGSVWVQPVTIVYPLTEGGSSLPYGWYADMSFGPHALEILALPAGSVAVTFHDALMVNDFPDRKSLATKAQQVVASAMPPERLPAP